MAAVVGSVLLGKWNLQVGSAREGPGLGDPGQGNPGQKDRGREDRQRGDSGPRESARPGSGSSRDRSSTRCHFSWTCCRRSEQLVNSRASAHEPGVGRSNLPAPSRSRPRPRSRPITVPPVIQRPRPLQIPPLVRGQPLFGPAP